jgi:hypothetical protein
MRSPNGPLAYNMGIGRVVHAFRSLTHLRTYVRATGDAHVYARANNLGEISFDIVPQPGVGF